MKEKILALRKKGKTYNEIVEIVGCSKSLVAFHCSLQIRNKQYKRNNASRIKRTKKLKEMFGGSCCKCGYNRCLAALDFHHKDPEQKIGAIGFLLRRISFEKVIEEAKKCELICANCHREFHEEAHAAIV